MKSIILILVTLSVLVSHSAVAKPDHDKPLPPGLIKKVNQGKPLPPGWQKKLYPGQYLADDYYYRSTVLKKANVDGIITVQIEGTIVELYEHSRAIVRILEGNR